MKRLIIFFSALLLLTTSVEAKLLVIGKGDATKIDVSNYPPSMQAAYKVMEAKCVKCHSLERTAIAIETGVAPITGGIFDHGATRAYGIKMMRKPDSNMTKDDVKVVVELMNYMLDEVNR